MEKNAQTLIRELIKTATGQQSVSPKLVNFGPSLRKQRAQIAMKDALKARDVAYQVSPLRMALGSKGDKKALKSVKDYGATSSKPARKIDWLSR